MVNKMVWDDKAHKFIETGKAQKGDTLKVSLGIEQYQTLQGFAKADGYSFAGVSYETMKGTDGKTKHDKDGKPIFKLDKEGKKIVQTVEQSREKINHAVAQYVAVAVQKLIDERKSIVV